MQNKFILNIKNILSVSFKVLCFILFARYMIFIDNDLCKLMYKMCQKAEVFLKYSIVISIACILAQYVRIILEYAVAKRLGIIQFLNKRNFFLSLLYVLIMEVFITLQALDKSDGYIVGFVGLLISMFMFSLIFFSGFLYTFLVYRFFRFLSNKFKIFRFLKKFYPKILDKIPALPFLIILSIFAYPYGKYILSQETYPNLYTFLYSTEVLLAIIVVYTVFASVKTLYGLYKKQKTN